MLTSKMTIFSNDNSTKELSKPNKPRYFIDFLPQKSWKIICSDFHIYNIMETNSFNSQCSGNNNQSSLQVQKGKPFTRENFKKLLTLKKNVDSYTSVLNVHI